MYVCSYDLPLKLMTACPLCLTITPCGAASAEGVAAPLRLTTHVLGEIINDAEGNMWVNVAAGTPGSWLRLAVPTTSGSLNLLASPKRVYDSRVGALPAIDPKTPLTNLTSRTIDCKGNASGVPAGARGVLLNVTVVTLTANGFLAVTPGGAPVGDAMHERRWRSRQDRSTASALHSSLHELVTRSHGSVGGPPPPPR